jgi:hypothetical protein
MRSSAAQIIEDIHQVRSQQERDLERLGHAPSLTEQREMADIADQRRQLFQDLEMSLPQPGAQDRPRDYEVALLRRLQRFSHSFRDSDLARLAAAGGLARGIQEAIISDASAVAGDMTVGSFRRPGALREIRRADQTGQVTISFAGDPLRQLYSEAAEEARTELERLQSSSEEFSRAGYDLKPSEIALQERIVAEYESLLRALPA